MKPILVLDAPHALFFEALDQNAISYVCDYESNLEGITNKIHDYRAIVMRSRVSLDQTFFDKAQHLEFVAREGVGLDHIDLEAASAFDIQIITSPEGSRDTVAEHAIGLLLNIMNNTSKADREVRAGKWLREANRGCELGGSTVGILGYGNMGQSLAKKLSGFGCRCIAYDKYRTNYADEYAQAVALEGLFAQSDILSIHIPLDKLNRHFVNADFLNQFSKPIFLVNTARGLVLETSALVGALKEGKVRAAALDVLEYEDTSFNFLDLLKEENANEDYQYLKASDRVLLNPHIAGWSYESKRKHAQVLAQKIVKHFKG